MLKVPLLKQVARSSIVRSEMHGVFPKTRVPAPLNTFVENGERKPIMPKSRKHYGSNDTCVNLQVMDAVGDAVCRNIVNSSTEIVHTHVLSMESAIQGDTGQNVPPLDKNTSAGFTMNLVKQQLGLKGKGKTWIFGSGDGLDITTPEAQAVMWMCRKAVETLEGGDRVYCIFLDCLKDELRSYEKVAEGSTRLFCAADLIYLILCKMYFGAFACWIYENRIRNGVAIGINPYGNEWDFLYKFLRRKGDNGIFGDFGKYDKRLLACLIYMAYKLIVLYYGFSDLKANKVRAMLFEELINSFHAIPDGDFTAIYEWLHGNTSGNFLTAIINSIANLCLCIYIFVAVLLRAEGKDIMIAKPIDCPIDFCINESAIETYGDDVAISVSDELKAVGFYSMQREIKRCFGLEFTDELKGKNGEVDDHRPIKEGNFIARGFEETSFFGPVRMMAGLRLPSILEAPQWYKGKIDSHGIVLITERCLVELAIRGEEDHAKYGMPLAQRCYKEYKVWPRFTNWETTMSMLEKVPAPLYSPMSELKELDLDFMNFLAADEKAAELKT
jgi:hypothetical protein